MMIATFMTSGTPQKAPTVKPGYLPTLDGWRSIAILAVIFSHAYGFLQFGYTRLAHILHWPGVVYFLPKIGEKGVELFFGISGFLICSRLIEEQNACGHISLKGFYIRRASRILPPALNYLLFISILALLGAIAENRMDILSSVFFFRNYHSASDWYTGHFWSLAVEEHFYLLWPSTVALLGLTRSRWAAIFGILAVVVWRGFHWQAMATETRIHTDLRLDGLLMGCLTALFAAELQKFLTRRSAVILPALLLAIYIAVDQVSGPLVTVSKLIQATAVALVIVATVFNPGWLFSRLMESAPLKWIGRLSYSLYLWQQLFFYPSLNSHRFLLAQAGLRVGGAFVAAYLSYKFIEKPAIKWGHRHAPPVTPGRGDLTGEQVRGNTAQVAVAGTSQVGSTMP